MLSIFKRDPLKKLKKQHGILLEKAMQAQRNGDIRLYSELSVKADEIYKDIQAREKN